MQQPTVPPKKEVPLWFFALTGIILVVITFSLFNLFIDKLSATTQRSVVVPTVVPTTQPSSQTTKPTTLSRLPPRTLVQPTRVPPARPTPIVALAEHLTFRGDLSGVLIAGDDPQPMTNSNPLPAYVQQHGNFFDPAPTSTQCSDFDSGIGRDAVAVIVGTVGIKRYAVTIEVNENNAAYLHPGTPLYPGVTNRGGSLHVYEVSGTQRWQQVTGPAQQEMVIILHAARASGTVDAWLAMTGQAQRSAPSTLHLYGTWRCQ